MLWGWDKIAGIPQTTFPNAFSWMKMYEIRFRFHRSLFPRFQWPIFQHWVRLWLGAEQATSHYLNQWWLIYRWIYASFGLNDLNMSWSLVHVTHNTIWNLYLYLRYSTGRSSLCNLLFLRCSVPCINFLYVGPLFGNIVLNENWFVRFRYRTLCFSHPVCTFIHIYIYL